MKEITYHYSLLAKSLSEQAEEQGCILEQPEFIQRVNDAIFLLRFSGLLPDSDFDKVMKRFNKLVVSNTRIKEEVSE